MTLSAGTILASELVADFDAPRADLDAATARAAGDFCEHVRAVGLLSGDDIGVRSTLFTPRDDLELVALGLDAFGHASTALTVTATLARVYEDADGDHVEDADGTGGQVRTLSASTTDSTGDHEREQYTATGGERITLLAGVTYRLALTSSHAADAAVAVSAWVLLRPRWRRT